MTDTITRLIERAPDFLKQELLSKDAGVRARAEAAIATMIAAALTSADHARVQA